MYFHPDPMRHTVRCGIDEEEVARLYLPVRLVVVKNRRVRPAADDRRIPQLIAPLFR